MPVNSNVEAATTTLTTYHTKAAVYLRATTSYKSKQVILIPKQKSVTYLAKKGSWIQIRYANRTGYVNEQSLTRKVQKGVAVKAAPYVTQRQAVIYTGVDARKKQAFTLKKGVSVTITEQLAGFLKIRSGNKSGWIPSKDVKKAPVVAPKPPAPKPIKKTPFLTKQKSMDYLKKYRSTKENRYLFDVVTENGLNYVDFQLFQTRTPIYDYLYITGNYDRSKLSSVMFIRTRYNKYPTGQAVGDEAAHIVLASFFGEGTKETEELRNLYNRHIDFTKNAVIPITIGGNKGTLLLWYGKLEFIFDYNGNLSTIRI